MGVMRNWWTFMAKHSCARHSPKLGSFSWLLLHKKKINQDSNEHSSTDQTLLFYFAIKCYKIITIFILKSYHDFFFLFSFSQHLILLHHIATAFKKKKNQTYLSTFFFSITRCVFGETSRTSSAYAASLFEATGLTLASCELEHQENLIMFSQSSCYFFRLN